MDKTGVRKDQEVMAALREKLDAAHARIARLERAFPPPTLRKWECGHMWDKRDRDTCYLCETLSHFSRMEEVVNAARDVASGLDECSSCKKLPILRRLAKAIAWHDAKPSTRSPTMTRSEMEEKAMADVVEVMQNGCSRHDLCRLIVEARADALKEAAGVAETLGAHPALNLHNGGPEWYQHGQRISAAILALAEKEAPDHE